MKRKGIWQSLRIGGKIRAGLAVLVFGYFVSMAFGFFLGRYTEKQVYDVEASMFPAAIRSQQALSAFNNQIMRYAEAVIAGDPELLDTAWQHSIEATQALEAIAALTGLSQEHRAAVRETMEQFRQFTSSAQSVYTIMSEASDDQDALETVADVKLQAAELAQQTDSLRQAFETFAVVFENTLKTDMSAIRTRSQQNRYLNVAVFVLVVSVTMVAVNRLITREISQPIQAIVETAHATAQGDLSQQLHFARHDEIGALAEAFRHMRTTIRAVLHETERLIHAIQAGQLTIRGKAGTFQGEWRDLVQGLMALLKHLCLRSMSRPP